MGREVWWVGKWGGGRCVVAREVWWVGMCGGRGGVVTCMGKYGGRGHVVG